jgi:acetyl-CoA carboxylase biotin carboxyl carrier protein
MSEAMHSMSSVVELLRRHDIDEFEMWDGASHFKIVLQPSEIIAPVAAAPDFMRDTSVEVTSPGSGTFVARHPSRSKDFVAVGDLKQQGECIALIQIGPIYRPVVAPFTGKILQMLCKPGDAVDFSFPLFVMQMQTAI